MNGDDVRVIEHQVVLLVGNAGHKMKLAVTGQREDGLYSAKATEHTLPPGGRCRCDTSHLVVLDADFEKAIIGAIEEHWKICQKEKRKRHLRLVTD